jgi:CHAT domain-containing protein/Tfp pilus assembly protein PilF
VRTSVLGMLLILPLLGRPSTIASQAATGDEKELKRGVVVEKLSQGWEAEKAGVQKGDVIVSWVRGDAKGTIESPFDLEWVEIEQRPLGTVVLAGFRGGEEREWLLGPTLWGLDTRPNFSGALLQRYQAGQTRSAAGNFEQARRSWSALSKDPTSPPWLTAWLSFHAARLLTHARRWVESDAAYTEAVRLSPAEGHSLRAQILSNWGEFSLDRKDLNRAEEHFQESAVEQRGWGDETNLHARTLGDLASVSLERHDDLSAERYYSQALAIRQSLAPESLDTAATLEGLGTVAWFRNDVEGMELYYGQAAQVRDKYRDEEVLVCGACDYVALAEAALIKGDLPKAEAYFGTSLARVAKNKNESYMVEANLIGLGIVMQQRGDMDGAGRYFHKALTILKQHPEDELNLAVVLGRLGALAKDRGQLGLAFRYQRRVRRMQVKLGLTHDPNAAGTLEDLGELAKAQGNLTRAETYMLRALKVEDRLGPGSVFRADTLQNLGRLALDRQDLDKAERYFQQGLAIAAKYLPGTVTEADSLAGLASVASLRHQGDLATQYYDRALAALENQTARLGGTSEIRADFRAQHADYYRDYIQLLVEQHQVEAAFQQLERFRARTLLETLGAARLNITSGADPAVLERERDLQRQIRAQSDQRLRLAGAKTGQESYKALEIKISDLLAQYQEIQGKIRASTPIYADLTQPQALSVSEIQQELLDPDTILLEYSLGKKSSYVFALTSTQLLVFSLPKRAVIEREARRLYSMIKARNLSSRTGPDRQHQQSGPQAEYAQAAATLSRLVLHPVGLLVKDKRLLIVADGALQYIPFAMLPEPAADRVVRHIPLIVNHEIINLPSASVLAALRRQERGRLPATKAVAVLADPVFDRRDTRVAAARAENQRPDHRGREDASASRPSQHENQPVSLATDSLTRSAVDVGLNRNGGPVLPRLRFSRLEAESIVSVAPRGQTLLALDFNASRAAALDPQLSQYRIVHFATHGLLDSEHPELSGLVFSLVDKNGKPQEGFLTLQDIYNMNLPAELVVLSACETGLGKDISGEGLVGLTRGFMYAGASRVVASLWKVSDVATARLMAEFYKAMESEGMRPAEALRAAQIRMWRQKRWSSPYYWAGFQLQGEWK